MITYSCANSRIPKGAIFIAASCLETAVPEKPKNIVHFRVSILEASQILLRQKPKNIVHFRVSILEASQIPSPATKVLFID